MTDPLPESRKITLPEFYPIGEWPEDLKAVGVPGFFNLNGECLEITGVKTIKQPSSFNVERFAKQMGIQYLPQKPHYWPFKPL